MRASIPLPLTCEASALPFELIPLPKKGRYPAPSCTSLPSSPAEDSCSRRGEKAVFVSVSPLEGVIPSQKSTLQLTGELAQMVERSLSMREVAGSMPAFSRRLSYSVYVMVAGTSSCTVTNDHLSAIDSVPRLGDVSTLRACPFLPTHACFQSPPLLLTPAQSSTFLNFPLSSSGAFSASFFCLQCSGLYGGTGC